MCIISKGLAKVTHTQPTGNKNIIMPIRTRRATLCLRYLKYLMELPNTHYASLALEENIKLRNSGSACWLSDLDFAIAHLPGNHRLPPLHALDADRIDKLIKAVDFSTKSELQTHISWSKLSLLRHRLEPKEEGPAKTQIIGLRHYLTQVSTHSHRRTITKLLCGDLTPQVFRGSPSPLRILTTTEQRIRLCRSCNHQPETPQHILFQCPSLPSIISLRSTFIATMRQFRPLPANSVFSDASALHYLKAFIFDWTLIVPTSKFIHVVVVRWQYYLDTGTDQLDTSAVSDDGDSDEG
ncbi:MAG: hypothetical protein NXY57DRAFT_1021911 [Lentinula lateritia]|nr:MAG: hypothetical protein NXY57DRAFT_1021911 [Lentinula lateritia]